MNEITIQEYDEKDFEHLVQLVQRNIPDYFAQEELEDFKDYLLNQREDYFVAIENGEIIGCGGINYEKDTLVAKISWDAIHPSHQGKGVGNKILQHRIRFILENHPDCKIIVRTTQWVFPFYEKNGFQLIETQKDYWAPGFDLYKMEYRV